MGSRSPGEEPHQGPGGRASLPPMTGTGMLLLLFLWQHSGDDQVNGGSRAVPSSRGHLFPFRGFGSGFIISSSGGTVRPFYQEGLSGRGHGRLLSLSLSPSCENSF